MRILLLAALAGVSASSLSAQCKPQFDPVLGKLTCPKPGGGGGGNIPSTTSVLKGDGAGNATPVTGTGTNCVLVNGSSVLCGGATGPANSVLTYQSGVPTGFAAMTYDGTTLSVGNGGSSVVNFTVPYTTGVNQNGEPLAPGGSVGIDIRVSGADCTGVVDATSQLNTLFAAAADGTTFVMPVRCYIKLTDTIGWTGKSGVKLISPGAPGALAVGQARFIWYGADGGIMFQAIDSDGGEIGNIEWWANNCGAPPGSNSCDATVRNVAGVGIDLDQTASPVHIMSNWYIHGNQFTKGGAHNDINAVGIRFSHVSQSNVENMFVEGNFISCSGGVKTNGTGISIGPSGNTLGYLISKNSVEFCGVGMFLSVGGGTTLLQNSMQSNGVAFQFDNGAGSVAIIGTDAENNTQFMTGNATGGEISLIGNSIRVGGPSMGHAVIETDAKIFSSGNEFVNGVYQQFLGGPNAKLYSTMDSYPYGTLALSGWDTMKYVEAHGDTWCSGSPSTDGCTGQVKDVNYLSTGADPGSDVAPGVNPVGTGSQYYAPHTNKWRMSENGGAFQDVLPTISSSDPGCDAVGRRWYNTTTSAGVFETCLFASGAWTILGSPGTQAFAFPGTVGDAVKIGQFSAVGSGFYGTFDILVADKLDNIAKVYSFAAPYLADDTWHKAIPISQAIYFGSSFAAQDWDLEVLASSSETYDLRIRRTVGSGAATGQVYISRFSGSVGFTPCTVSCSVSAPAALTTIWPGTTISQHDGVLDIYNTVAKVATLTASALSAPRTFTFPNVSGTFCVGGGSCTSPTFVTPVLGTPSSGNASNLTNIPVANATGLLPQANLAPVTFPAAGTSVTLAAPSEFYECSSTCTVTLPVPAAGLQFCVRNANNVTSAITLAALGSSAQYELTDFTAYGTAGTGTAVSSGALGDRICLVGRNSTHYDVFSFGGTWTMN